MPYYCRCGRFHKHDKGPEKIIARHACSDTESKTEPEEDMNPKKKPRLLTPLEMEKAPIRKAVKHGNPDQLISLLGLQQGEKCRFNKEVRYAFIKSCQHSKFNFVQALFARGLDLLAQDNFLLDTPLHVACREGNLKVAKYIVKLAKQQNLVDDVVNACNMFTETPLHVGAGSCDIIAFLLSLGADPCKKDRRDILPYGHAYDRTKAMEMLRLAYRKGPLVPTFSKESQD